MIILLAAIGAVGTAFYCRNYAVSDIYPDAVEYDEMATTILTKGTYTLDHPSVGCMDLYDTNCRPPGYPAFLALIYRIAGHRPFVVFLAQALLFVATLLLVNGIWLHITQSESQAALATGLCALWLDFYPKLTILLSEILAAALIAAVLWLLLKAVERPTRGKCIMLGLSLGAITLVKPVVGPFILVAALFVLLSGKDFKHRLGMACLVCLAAGAMIVPWTARNYRVTGAFVPVCTGGGYNFWIGNWPRYYVADWPDRKVPPEILAKLRGMPDVERGPDTDAAGNSVYEGEPCPGGLVLCIKVRTAVAG